jgi:hypothetical protein
MTSGKYRGRRQMMQSRSGPFQLCFRSLFDPGRGYAFPCDGSGRVDLDQLSDTARNNYLYARAMVGRELAAPAVEAVDLH